MLVRVWGWTFRVAVSRVWGEVAMLAIVGSLLVAWKNIRSYSRS
jgi:hypothetical protein